MSQTDQAHQPRSAVPFWTVAVVLTLFLTGASAPSPLYALYASRWHFSPTTLTAVFAVYAIALLAVLLTCGGLSDAVGRRPVLLAGHRRPDRRDGPLPRGRRRGLALRRAHRPGLATGLVTAAAAAALLDLQPRRSTIGPLVNALAPSVGLALGAVGAGAPRPVRAGAAAPHVRRPRRPAARQRRRHRAARAGGDGAASGQPAAAGQRAARGAGRRSGRRCRCSSRRGGSAASTSRSGPRSCSRLAGSTDRLLGRRAACGALRLGGRGLPRAQHPDAGADDAGRHRDAAGRPAAQRRLDRRRRRPPACSRAPSSPGRASAAAFLGAFRSLSSRPTRPAAASCSLRSSPRRTCRSRCPRSSAGWSRPARAAADRRRLRGGALGARRGRARAAVRRRRAGRHRLPSEHRTRPPPGATPPARACASVRDWRHGPHPFGPGPPHGAPCGARARLRRRPRPARRMLLGRLRRRGTTSSTAQDPAALLAKARATLDAAPSLAFSAPGHRPPRRAATSCSAAPATSSAPTASPAPSTSGSPGVLAKVEVISTGGTFYAKLPLTTTFAQGRPEDPRLHRPRRLHEPGHGHLAAALAGEGPAARRREPGRRRGRPAGRGDAAPGRSSPSCSPARTRARTSTPTFGVTAAGELRRAVLVGPFYAKGVEQHVHDPPARLRQECPDHRACLSRWRHPRRRRTPRRCVRSSSPRSPSCSRRRTPTSSSSCCPR